MKKIMIMMAVLAAVYGCSNYELLNSSVYNPKKLAEIKTYRIATPKSDQLPPNMNIAA